ncbi:MAG: hypothetical protein AAGG08_07545, partial [Actinomycetota bacterium]
MADVVDAGVPPDMVDVASTTRSGRAQGLRRRVARRLVDRRLVVRRLVGGFAVAMVATWALEGSVSAHVKWFSDFDFRDPPLDFADVLTVRFSVFLVAATVAIAALPAIDQWLETTSPYRRLADWLAA